VAAMTSSRLEHIFLNVKLNHQKRSASISPYVTLLDALRERFGATGTKKGCNHGACGACTVLIDGRRVLSCLTLAATCEGRDILTIEGLAGPDGTLHPMQDAFARHDAFQCGYCTPGQIMSAVGMLDEADQGRPSAAGDVRQIFDAKCGLTEPEVRERMSGNICRCAAYQNIVAAVMEVHSEASVTSDKALR
jgi:xanthine dehydrogenase YagT iron-sulfur-binding subunit